MSTTAPPTIPPRPTRAQQAAAAKGVSRMPEIPPRPANKKTLSNRSTSPAHYPQSPFFEMPSNTIGRTVSNDPSNQSLPPRPPSVNLPSLGQEGSEYADLPYDNPAPQSADGVEAAAQTRNVRGDLHLHAPKPSLPTSSAKTQVEAVTKTTAKQAAALGLGKPVTPVHDDQEHAPVPLRAKSSFSRPTSSASNERRASIVYVEEQGPAEQGGIRVPINPLLGDVQAPSPALVGDRASGVSANNGQRRRHHRTMSGREVFLPPGSYGLHGHGVPTQDKFEKDWYAKHPEQYLHDEDQGHYSSTGTGRGEFALSSEDLNDIVRSTASRGAGLGTSDLPAYPDEQIGYLASEQYASRSVSAPNTLSKLHSNVSQPAIESPLRKTSFPSDEVAHADFKKSKGSVSGRSDDVVDSEQDDDVIHVDDPKHHYHKITGGQESIREREDVQPYVTHPPEENGLIDEYGYSAPILAADEVAREVGGEDMQPAVPPTPDRRNSAYEIEFRGSGDITPSSRPVSRPSSIHGGIHGVPPSLSRFTSRLEDYREEMHTPLEDVDEYEPLFPDEDGKKKDVSPAERFKRPDALKHRFPSQDIWEDPPSSAMQVATVSTPDIPSQIEQPKEASSSGGGTFESPEAEAARKEKPTEEGKEKRIPNEERLANSKFAPHLRGDMQKRPGLSHRFPSQDIWEETPASQYLVTTVSSQQEEETASTEEASTSKPTVPPRPNKSRPGEGAPSAQIPPSVPPRPEKKVHGVPPADAKLPEISTSTSSNDEKAPSPTELRKVPSIPDRPKPPIPARPAKKTSGDSLSKTISATSAGVSGSIETEKSVPPISPPLVKAKPSIPPRPGQGNKIANLKGNFMNDLNQRLQLGPPKEKEPETEVEKEARPLEDARKGRARGPQRRAPAKSPSSSGEPAASTTEKSVRFSLSSPRTVWHINSTDGSLRVHSDGAASSTKLENVPEGSERVESTVKAAADDGLLQTSESDVAQMKHSPPGGAPMDRVAEGTAESKTAQASAQQTTDVPETMAPAKLAMNTAAEPVDPSPAADLATPHAEPANPMDKPRGHEPGDTSLSQQTTASSGALSGHALGRVRAEDHEQGSSLSKHTTASSTTSGATLDRQPTLEDSNINVADVAAKEPKMTAPVPAAPETEEKLTGADRPREPSGEEDITYKKLEEMTAKADGKGHSGLEPEV